MIQALAMAVGAATTGACIGSYASTAAIRGERSQSSVAGRSHCDGCGRKLGFIQTFPLVSFLALRGRCSACGSRIDVLHPCGEIAGAIVAGIAFATLGWPRGAGVAALGLVLLGSSLVDVRTKRLPDLLTLFAAAICACLMLASGRDATWMGLAAASVSLLGLEATRRIFAHARGRQGLGFGDVKLLAALALWLGAATPWALIAACIAALLSFAIIRPKDGRLAFGPFIAGAGWTIGLAREAHWWR